MSDRQSSAPAAGPEVEAILRHPSSMSHRLGWIHWILSRWAFAHVRVDPRVVERVRALRARGSIVYVMRYRSVADYLLLNAVFLREGMPLPQFSNGSSIGWFRTLGWIFARVAYRLRARQLFGASRRTAADLEVASRLAARGEPILLFLRSRARGFLGLFGRRRVFESVRIGDEYLARMLDAARTGSREVFVVPLAPFRGRGYRRRASRLSTLVYSVQEAPNELKKLLTFLFNRRDLSLTIGREISLRTFLDKYGGEGEERMVRRLLRTLQLFLYREERVVWGPPLLPKRRVRDLVLGTPEVRSLVARLAAQRGVHERKVEKEAAAYFDEMASNFNGTYFAILAFVFRRIWNRIFQGVEISGLDRVAERIREHPVVLVPCHRSHFDYLILSYIFHSQFLSPPHIAAGINLSFFPLGMLFRGAGAFFIRRTFEDNELYKTVFRQYLTYLIREGYTQEFFIEGGRSRTGKILTPRLGMLSAIVNAFIRGVRRDLYFVPVSISYERLVEEEAYKRELMGGEKEKESLGALFRARSVLRANYGKAYVSFGEPISLDRALGDMKERFRENPDDPEVEEERRHFTLKFGFELLRGVNAVSVVGAPSLAATVLLSNPDRAILRSDFLDAARYLLEVAEWEGAQITGALRHDRETFSETLAFLESSGLVKTLADPDGMVLHVPDDKRINLDFYKNNVIHFYVLLSLLSHGLARGIRRGGLKEDLWWWLELFRNEFVLPERERLAVHVTELLERLRALGAMDESEIDLDHPLLRVAGNVLENFREAYWVAARVLAALGPEGAVEGALLKEMLRVYHVRLLLGVLQKPEGSTTVTFQNAVDRFAELGYVRLEKRGRGGRDRWAAPGPIFPRLRDVERRLAASLGSAAMNGRRPFAPSRPTHGSLEATSPPPSSS